ncbi:MAG: tetratricopeptide repeat protein, partial [Treponema sp.]
MMRGKRLNKIWVIVFLFVSAWTFAAGKTAADFFKQGLAAEENDDWYAASQYFMEALHINPVYSDAYYHLAECSFQLGEFEFCLSHLDEAEKYEKGSDRVRNLRGAALISLDKYSQAREIFESVLKNSPNNIEARFGLAELDLFDGRVTGAENQYMEALKRQSTNRKALLSMSLVSAGLGKHDTALKYLKQVLNNYPGDSEVH